MPKFRIICLANSAKLGGRCVAGLRMDGKGWVRLVSNDVSSRGAIFPSHHQLPPGTEIKPLDIIEVGLISPLPQPHQPENWLIDYKPWRIVDRGLNHEVLSILQANIYRDSLLFGSYSDRIDYEQIKESPLKNSLVLVEPKKLLLYVTNNVSNRSQIRAIFQLENQEYDLVVTDPFMKKLVNSRPGLTSFTLNTKNRVLLTVSLGEPFEWDNCCYKLVAGVIVLPR